MPPKPYSIGTADVPHAVAYLQGKLLVLNYAERVSPIQAAKQFNEITLLPETERAVAINRWCEQLTPSAYRKLRLSIRKRRQVANPGIAVMLSAERHAKLTKLAIRKGISVAALIDDILAGNKKPEPAELPAKQLVIPEGLAALYATPEPEPTVDLDALWARVREDLEVTKQNRADMAELAKWLRECANTIPVTNAEEASYRDRCIAEANNIEEQLGIV